MLAERVWRGDGFGWDQPVADVLDALAPVSSEEVHVDPWVDGVTLAVGVLTAALAIGLLAARHARAAAVVVVGIAGSIALSTLTKALVERPVIEGAGTSSFPSGSATWSFATVAAVVLVAGSRRSRWLLALAGAAFTIAYSGVVVWEEWHYASDVLAGWLLGAVTVSGLWLVLGRPRAPLLDASAGRLRRRGRRRS